METFNAEKEAKLYTDEWRMKADKRFLDTLEGHMDNQATPEMQAILVKKQELEKTILLEGSKKDDGKSRWELVAYDAVEGVVKVLTFGAKKYAARNWEKGIMYGRVFGAIMRHLWKWWMGENNDEETGLSHLDHAMCEIMFLSAYEKRGMVAYDDRPNTKNA